MLLQGILQIRSALGSIRNIVELSRGKFRDEAFGESFDRFIGKEIEISDLLLDSLLNYIKTGTPIEKTNTIHTVIERVLTKYSSLLEEKNIITTKTFEKNLPETIVPDEQLKYILNSILLYAVSSTPPNGKIELLTKSAPPQASQSEVQASFEKGGKYIEIRVVSSCDMKSAGSPGRTLEEMPPLRRAEGFDLLLRLAKEVVLRNQGVIKFQTDDEKTRIIIFLRFPVERRKIIFHNRISTNRPTNPSFGSISNIPLR